MLRFTATGSRAESFDRFSRGDAVRVNAFLAPNTSVSKKVFGLVDFGEPETWFLGEQLVTVHLA